MSQNSFNTQTTKLLSSWTLLLIVIGLSINIILSSLVTVLELPLFFDTLGTILVGALSGIIPGMIVGFLSSAIRALSDSLNLYYGILSIIIGALSAIFSEKGYFNTVKGWLLTAATFVLITGVSGVSISWLLYGSSIGGTSAPLGNYLVAHHVPGYLAQFLADLVIEIPDKLLMTGGVCLIIKHVPKKRMEKYSLGILYLNEHDVFSEMKPVKKSITKRVTFIVMGSVLFSCIFSIVVCLIFYMRRVKTSCEDFAMVITKQEAGYIDGNMINTFLEQKNPDFQYRQMEENLNILYENAAQVKYMFVYALREDGIHVVFDIDTPDLEGEELGTVLEPEQGISSEYQNYLNGEEIPNTYTNGEYGNILTVYSPIRDSSGNVTAYAGVDIDMSIYYNEFAIFAIQVVSIIFAMAMLIFTFIIWYIQKHITKPIQIIVHQTEQLKPISPEKWLESDEWKNQITLHTQDELERLNDTVNEIEAQASRSMKRALETEQELLQTKELQEMNQKLEVAVQKAEDANKAKTDFLSRMSHDMRTPLNGILNFSEFISEADSLKEAKEYGRKIASSGHYLETLINDTLGMSRIESGKVVLKLEPYSYAQFEAAIKNVLEEKAKEKGVTLTFIHKQELTELLLMDSLRIQQVCINLLNNAIKFTPKGGLIEFHTECVKKDKKTEMIQFKIKDNGIGMSQSFVEEKLFLPFAQERVGKDNEETGTGLGLSIAKQLVEIMGGSLSCESKEGEGSTFTIILTADIASKEKAKTDKNTSSVQVKLKGLHILLCEDHVLNREIAIKLLKKQDCIVDTAENGKEGIELFEKNSELYDLILMDIRMPQMDGITATKAIRKMPMEKAKHIPIIAMTANAYEDDIRDCLDAGMNAHIAKPINPKIMFETIAKELEK